MIRDDLPLLTITGGLGRVAGVLAPLREHWRVRAVDRAPAAPGAAVTWDELEVGDLSDPEFVEGALSGSDAVLHLAANASPTSPWEIAAANVSLTDTVLTAAARQKVSRVVIASSVHASGGAHRAGELAIAPDGAAWPCCAYGASKVATEALARVFADSTGIPTVCIRFGLTGWELSAKEHAKSWLGDRDAVTLVSRVLASSPSFGVYHAVSRYASQFWSVGNAHTDLGWVPQEELPHELGDLPFATWAPCRLFRLDDSVIAQSGT
ncbi:MAG: NAD-dependent epimerase/dehydratase family protein [Salinibacterium amurskyense]